jgi:RimJ/RimL family protein N-acetyltransferase
MTTGDQNDPAIAAPDVRLRDVRDDDWPMLRRWLARPDIERWWGPKASSEAAIILAMDSSHAMCRIIEVAGYGPSQPVGYTHAIDATLWGETLPDELVPGTWDIDLFIAAPEHRNTGIGQRALTLIRDEVFATTLAGAVCIFASIANERAVRAYEKAGFRWQRVWNEPGTGPAWFMICERPRLL